MRKKIMNWLTLPIALLISGALQAEPHWYDYDHLYLQAGTYGHYEDSPNYKGARIFSSIEAVKADDTFFGLALFNNSYGDFSQYIYYGKSWELSNKLEGFHLKVHGGLMHGYKKEDSNRLRLGGVQIGLFPVIGYKKGRFGVELTALALDGLLLTVGMDL